MPIKDFRYIPLGFFLKAFVDNGYVVDNNATVGNAPLANTLLTGGGIGIDFITFFDSITSLEYSLNQRGQTNFFIRFSAGIK